MKRIFLTVVVSMLLAAPPIAAPAGSEDAAIERLQKLILMRSYGEGEAAGRDLIAQFPESRRLKAWWLVHLGRNGRTDEAVREAEALRDSASEDPWGWFALAQTLAEAGDRPEEARELAARFGRAFPDSWDRGWLQANVLQQTRQHQEAIDFIDGWRERVGDAPELLTVRGNAYYSLSEGGRKTDLFEKALASWDQAIAADPQNVGAWFLSGYYLGARKRYDESLERLSKAAELAPCSNSVHNRLWYTAGRMGDAVKAAAVPQMEAFIERCGDLPEAAYTVYLRAGSLDLPELEQRAAALVMERFPDSPGAEWVLVNRYRDLSKKIGEEKAGPDSQPVTRYRKMLREFIDRPSPVRTSLTGDAWRSLYYSLMEEDAPDAEQLLAAVEGMVKWENINYHTVYAGGAIALAEKTPYRDRALEIARAGIDVAREKIESRKGIYDNPQDFEDALKSGEALMRDAIGWVHHQSGNYTEAEKELLKASELSPSPGVDLLHHLGAVYEATGRLDTAEEHYIRGAGKQTPSTNPNEAALKTLYAKRHAGMEGFDEYWAGLEEIERANRKRDVLAARLETPGAAPAFDLKTLAGDRVTLESLAGKVVVINYWGIWCGWCVKEMPEFQLLHERYRDDPAVAILTINNDGDPADVPPWMEKHEYDFNVLLDDGYVSDKAQIRAFPTTWFLDPEGRKAFVKVGWTEKLLEEFSWRVEALRPDTGVLSGTGGLAGAPRQ